MKLTILLRVLAWLLLAGLVFVTLSPINLRPVSPLPTQLERAVTLAVVGFVFANAYPRHMWMVAFVVLGSTVLLEILQVVDPSRHGRIVDVSLKLVGAAFGLGVGALFVRQSRGDGKI